MKCTIPAGSSRSASTEAQDFTQQVRQAKLDAAVGELIHDAKVNEFSVVFSSLATEAQKAAVYAILKKTVTACDIDGTSYVRAPDDEPDAEDDDETTTACWACQGTRLNPEGDICPVCYGL